MKLLRRRRSDVPPEPMEQPDCEHITLIPSWGSAEDIGHQDRVSMYRCEACGREFSLEEAERLRETEAARLRRKMAS